MFCQKCGASLPDDAEICMSCGCAVESQNKKKKPLWKTLIISIAAIAVGTMIGKVAGTLIASTFNDAPQKNNQDLFIQAMESDRSSGTAESTVRENDLFIQAMEGDRSSHATESTAVENDLFIQAMEGKDNSRQPGSSGEAAERTDYDKVFDIRGLSDVSGISSGLSSIAAVRCYDVGGVECVEKQEFGFRGRTVVEMEWSYYYKTEGRSKEQIDALDESMRAYFGAALADVACCNLEYRQLNNYYRIRFTFTNVDNPSDMMDMLKAMEGLGSGIDADTYDLDYLPAPDASEFINSGYFVKES